MIVETSDNRFYKVWATGIAGMDHVWNGYEMKKNAAGQWVYKARYPKHPTIELVRKAATRVVLGDVHFMERA